MNIQARKLVLIEEFLRVRDEGIISQLELFFKQEKRKSLKKEISPMSLNELHAMIDQAKSDRVEGRVISHQELKKKVKTWK